MIKLLYSLSAFNLYKAIQKFTKKAATCKFKDTAPL